MIYAKRRFHITFGLHRFTITLAVDLRMNRKKICFELAIGWLFGDIRILAKAKCSVRYIHEWKTKEYVKRVFFLLLLYTSVMHTFGLRRRKWFEGEKKRTNWKSHYVSQKCIRRRRHKCSTNESRKNWTKFVIVVETLLTKSTEIDDSQKNKYIYYRHLSLLRCFFFLLVSSSSSSFIRLLEYDSQAAGKMKTLSRHSCRCFSYKQ